jgi:ADP-ribose pyrophosphatase YjhB (NUDIX family)
MPADSLRLVRYQGAIIREHHILLIRHQERASGRDYWVIPGGGLIEGETEEGCVIREMKEETNLDVRVERLLLDLARPPGRKYRSAKTYLCSIVGGEAQPGYEPEPEVAQIYAIVEVRWFDLRDQVSWGEKVRNDAITYTLLLKIRSVLGYL